MCGEPPKAGVGRAVGFMLAPPQAGFLAMLAMGAVLRNSLHALWAFRSNSRSKSEVDACCARRPHDCASQLRITSPQPAPPPPWAADEMFGFEVKISSDALCVSD